MKTVSFIQNPKQNVGKSYKHKCHVKSDIEFFEYVGKSTLFS